MTDGVIAGTGNSRYLKSIPNFLEKYPTYENMGAALAEGTLPIDFNGINAAGWIILGTLLNKAALLTDATAAGMGLTSTATPNDAFAKLRSLITTAQNTASGRAQIQYGTYEGTGARSESNPNVINLAFQPKVIIVSRISSTLSGSSMNTYNHTMVAPYNKEIYTVDTSATTTSIVKLKFEGNKVSIYTASDSATSDIAFNRINCTYGYVAIT